MENTASKIAEERIPVIIGIGEVTERLTDGAIGREPLALLQAAISAAFTEVGVGAAAQADLSALIDGVELVNQMGWRYGDLARSAAEAAGLSHARATQSPVGGNMPTWLLAEAGRRIHAGELRGALICGVEATASLAAAARVKQTPSWTPQPPAAARPKMPDFFHPEAIKYGLHLPLDVYPLYDNACRAAWGQSFDAAQEESGVIGAQMSQAASNNPYAWLPQARDAAEVRTPSSDNRLISYPYTKWMIANPMVNQASAVIVTSLANARALGVPHKRLIYVWSGVGGAEPRDILARHTFTEAPAMDAVLKRVLTDNGLDASPKAVELYSCFPSVPKLARRSLGLAAGHPLSVTGGLVFFGAPVNNYMGHAICAMVRTLRTGCGDTGLLYGNGEYVTKHHAVIVSRKAPDHAPQNISLQDELDAHASHAPAVLTAYSGPSRIESYTVKYGRDGAPESGTVVARTATGERHLARVTDAATLSALVSPTHEPIDMPGVSATAADGFNYWIQG